MRHLRRGTPQITWMLLLAALACTTCARPGAPRPTTAVVKVQIRLPQGTSLERADDRAGAVAAILRGLPGMQRWETIARPEELEAYVQITSARPTEDVQAAFQKLALPDAGTPEISTLTGDMPEVVPQAQSNLVLDVDFEKAAALGITARDINDAVAAYTSSHPTRGPEELSVIYLKAGEGQQVPLSAVAHFTLESRPDCIVHKGP